MKIHRAVTTGCKARKNVHYLRLSLHKEGAKRVLWVWVNLAPDTRGIVRLTRDLVYNAYGKRVLCLRDKLYKKCSKDITSIIYVKKIRRAEFVNDPNISLRWLKKFYQLQEKAK